MNSDADPDPDLDSTSHYDAMTHGLKFHLNTMLFKNASMISKKLFFFKDN
jgi:hypothetical protein